MSRLIDKAELFNRLANIKAPPEANEYKAEVYSLINGMQTVELTQESRKVTQDFTQDLISKKVVQDALIEKISRLNAEGEKAINTAREFIRFKHYVDGLTPVWTKTIKATGHGIWVEDSRDRPLDRLAESVKKATRTMQNITNTPTESTNRPTNPPTDLISRQYAIKQFGEDGTWLERQGVTTLSLVEAKQRAVDLLESLPSAVCDDCIWHICNYNKVDWDADVVSKGVFDQVKWERDTALKTLEEHGIGFGERAEPKTEMVLCALADRTCPFQGQEFVWCLTCPHISEEDRDLVKKAVSEPKTGEWIFNPKDAIELMFSLPKCSNCGFESADCGNFCPNCGARMRGEDDA